MKERDREVPLFSFHRTFIFKFNILPLYNTSTYLYIST